MTNQKNDLYAILGVGRDASEAEIKRAYRDMAKVIHPEGSQPNPVLFLDATTAFDILSKPAEREKYDRFGGFTDDIHDVNFNKMPEGYVATQTEATEFKSENQTNTNTAKEGKTTQAETKTRTPEADAFYSGETHTFFDYLRYFKDAEEGKVTDIFNEGKSVREIPQLDLSVNPITYGKIEMHEPEINLMAGCVRALSETGLAVVDCGDYRVTKLPDEGDVKGKMSVEIRLGRLKRSDEIKMVKEGGMGYGVVSDDTFVEISSLREPFAVIGINKPFNLERNVNMMVDMAGKIQRGETVDGGAIIALGVEDHMCFTNKDGRVRVNGVDLGNELTRRSGISVPEGSIFGQRNKEGVRRSTEYARRV